MPSKHSGWWSGLGPVLTGIAAVITACGWIYFGGDAGGPKPSVTMAEATASETPVGGAKRATRFDAMEVRKDMFDARKAALSVKCDRTRPDVYGRAETIHNNAEEELKAERYDNAVKRFKEASSLYRECAQAA